ncbi:substrate-binding domain-containing protein [Clostridium sp. 1001271B_151109_B4]|uniref:substrate-binding domain-containing protein n=1 Tax=Clostridium sp. 1001271B_151109_B4 TaxID=2787148 RepID=UPI0018A94625|nr:substrate-binding domain-containing protein [Clostridium sp. 1001271B_151109_B4]
MKKSKKIKLLVLIILLLISFILLFYELLFSEKNKSYQISVIASGKSDESFMILKEGAEQAALEMNANIRFLFLSKDNNEEEQIELIKRESENAVDALLISPIESEVVEEVIEEAEKKIPIILIQSLLNVKSDIKRVVCDEYQLGKSLAEGALSNVSKDTAVMVITSDNNSTSNNERYRGIIEKLDEVDSNYFISDIKNYIDYTILGNEIKLNNIGVIICVDRNITEKVAELKKKIISEGSSDNVLIFGVGNTNKIISLLEEEIVNATAVQNEFNIGYIAVKNAIELNNGEKVEDVKMIKSTVIASEDMYSPKNERILFQFIR